MAETTATTKDSMQKTLDAVTSKIDEVITQMPPVVQGEFQSPRSIFCSLLPSAPAGPGPRAARSKRSPAAENSRTSVALLPPLPAEQLTQLETWNPALKKVKKNFYCPADNAFCCIVECI